MKKNRKKQITRLIRQMNYTSVKYKTPERIRRRIWIFHEEDTDLQPSILHGHSQDDSYRLDAITGKFYEKDKLDKSIGTLRKKELSKLHGDKKFQVFTINRIRWVNKNVPRANFVIPDWACSRECAIKQMLHKDHKISTFVYIV